ncbi:MAG: histone deacetylase family protein, partial [Myxococcota bacterium]
GPGQGANRNYPLPLGTGWVRWSRALSSACDDIAAFGIDALVVSLGVDTYKDDPISEFALDREDYPTIGARLAEVGKPTLFVLEGGYAVDAIGDNVVGVLRGFAEAC